MGEAQGKPGGKSEILIYQSEDGRSRIQVRLEGGMMPRFLPQGPDLAPWELGFLTGALALLAWAVAGAWEADRTPARESPA